MLWALVALLPVRNNGRFVVLASFTPLLEAAVPISFGPTMVKSSSRRVNRMVCQSERALLVIVRSPGGYDVVFENARPALATTQSSKSLKAWSGNSTTKFCKEAAQ